MSARKRIQEDLEARGISAEFSQALAKRLDRVVDRLHPEIYDAVLTGATLAYGEHREDLDAVRRGASEMEEVEGLLMAFAEELQKLDEALEVLAVYTQRMRDQVDSEERVLH